jgi:hypothetical membrane protein
MTRVKHNKPERQLAITQLISKIKESRGIMPLSAAYLLMLLAMFILPLFSVPEYSIIRNTLSELGAQSAPGAWIMNIVFTALALGSVIAGWRFFDGFVFHRIILILFGVSLALMAFFNHAPVNPEVQYNLREDGWHAYFAGTAVLSFIILSIATSFILEKQQDRQLARAAGTSAMVLMVLMAEADRLAGVWQRLILIISFGWMIYCFKASES